MGTGTEYISEISATTILTSFNFHTFRFSSFRYSGEGEVDVYRIFMCLCFIVSIPCHGIRSWAVISQPGSFATNQLATKKPSRHQPTRRQIKQWR